MKRLILLLFFLEVFIGVKGQNASKVVRVIDGDTIELEDSQKVRLLGIDTPERSEKYFHISSVYLESLVLDQVVELKTDNISRKKDKYGRLLRYIILEGEDINLKMVQNGYAKALLKYPFDRMRVYAEAENQAKRKKLGIWAQNPKLSVEVLTPGEEVSTKANTKSNVKSIKAAEEVQTSSPIKKRKSRSKLFPFIILICMIGGILYVFRRS